MSKPEWGVKRTCMQCGEHFYDMKKDPIVCPYCGETLPLEEFLRLQMICGAKNKKLLKNKLHEELDVVTAVVEEDVLDDVADDVVDDDLELIEDASDLSDDNNDVESVMGGHMDKGEE